jgi:hypothetical protein
MSETNQVVGLLGTLIERWRAYSMAAGQASVEGGPEGADSTYASAEAYSFKRCADELEAALKALPPAPPRGLEGPEPSDGNEACLLCGALRSHPTVFAR